LQIGETPGLETCATNFGVRAIDFGVNAGSMTAFTMKYLFAVLSLVAANFAHAGDFPRPYNTQVESIPFTKPEEALKGVHLPEGFKATLFAHEPELEQPIGFATDARGRIWVAENYTYAERAVNYDTHLRDRILILEDTDGDGIADKRTVFWDQAVELTSVLPAFGGVFALCPPRLLFIPDANGDDVPDGEPQVLLDGFDASAVRHNIANGLKFGPDGWIYGRHGILASSKVGRPGVNDAERTLVNAGIWRYHPVTHKFEMVSNGTTNPWGHDWDENGQLFFINTVIGHLWHVVPGAYYRKMYGEHPNPYLYELIEQTADHFHWDTKERWDDIRKLGVTGTTSERGGGHAHSGFMIYLGDDWPDRYRNTAFAVNYHGRRLNNDRLVREGATYVGKHSEDMMFVDDPWFRGVDLLYGPDGGVYVTDWSDIGECHDDTGVHRTSGRIYKIVYKDVKPWKGDLNRSSNEELVALLSHKNAWFSRMAQEVLHARAAKGQDMKGVHAALHRILDTDPNATNKLHALWTLYVTGDLDEAAAQALLKNRNENLRTWGIQFLVDQGPPSASSAVAFAKMARAEKSGLPLTFLASAMRKATAEQRLEIARGLVTHGEFADDRVFPLMVWYAIQPDVPKFSREMILLAGESKLPKVRRFITRRIFEDMSVNPTAADQIVQLLKAERPADFQFDILTGIDEALKGVQKAAAPASWKEAAQMLARATDSRVRELFQQLNALFGDGRALDNLRAVVADKKAELPQRRRALATLLQSRSENLVPLIVSTFDEMDISQEAIRGLAAIGDPSTPDILLKAFNDLKSGGAKSAAVSTLASRPAWAARLLDAVQRGEIKRAEISAADLRQLRALNEPAVTEKIATIWPEFDDSPGGKKQVYEKYKNFLTPTRLSAANASQGRVVFQQVCAVCHTLFGEGAKIGPDLTGSDRRNIDYLLDNILNPSAVVPETYRVSNIAMKDDRVLSGIILNQTERMVTVQTPNEKLTLEKSAIESIKPSQLSMMPDGLLNNLSDEQTANLFAYLMSQTQVDLPK
jgi:putative membrane-bound dehydrogenase-like protein